MKNLFKLFGKHKKKSSLSLAVILALPLTAQYEGLRTRAYLDPVGIPTICFGETQDVSMGDIKTVEECKTMLTARLGYFAAQVDLLVIPEYPPEVMAAMSSISYNIGLGAFKKSSMLRLLNEGKPIAACNYLSQYNKAGGKILPGLVKRREAERKLCLSGL